jgi:hypothetical protein
LRIALGGDELLENGLPPGELLLRQERESRIRMAITRIHERTTRENGRGGGELRADGVETLEARYFGQADLGSVNLARWARIILPHLFANRGKPWIQPLTRKPPRAAQSASSS